MTDLHGGVVYLTRRPTLLQPLLLTFVTIVVTGPVVGLLAAIMHARGGSIVDLGMLGAATSMGAFAGATFAGARAEGINPTRYYALLGLVAAAAVILFVQVPAAIAQLVSLATIGFIMFAAAVWNTSRIRQIADAAYQARLQAITSMAFTLGFTVSILWAGVAIDWLGVPALLGGAVGLGLCSAVVAIAVRHPLDQRQHGGQHGAQADQ